jgi:hypothetical protein
MSVKTKFKAKMKQWDKDGILPVDYLEKVATITAKYSEALPDKLKQ